MDIKEKVLEISQDRKKKEQYVRGLFDGIAPKYDLMNGLISMGLDSRWRSYAVKRLGVFPGAYVLDGCCGTGDYAMAGSRKAGCEGLVAAFDFSSRMLEMARPKLAGLGYSHIRLQRADALNLPYKDNTFNFATVGWGIRNLADMSQGLREFHRVLKPGGRFACLDLGRPVIPGFSWFFHLYFFKLVPLMGKWVANNYEAYAYLPNSLHTFPDPEKLKAMMLQAGFAKAGYTNLAGGAMALHLGEKG